MNAIFSLCVREGGGLLPPSVFGLFWGWLFLDQVPASTTWIALLLILAGLAVTSTKYARRSA